MSILWIGLSSVAVVLLSTFPKGIEPMTCFHYYADQTQASANETIWRGARCVGNACWRARLSFPQTQKQEERDIVEGGCIDRCDDIGLNKCLYDEDIPHRVVGIRTAKIYGVREMSHARAEALCCCDQDLCNGGIRADNLLALTSIAFIATSCLFWHRFFV